MSGAAGPLPRMNQSRHYLAGLPLAEYEIFGKTFLCKTRSLFKSLATYDSTLPTNPSPGRVYKRNFSWWNPDVPDDWWVYICQKDPDDPNVVMHVPYKLQVEPEIIRDLVLGKFIDA